MKALDELYGLHVVYNGLEHSSQLSSMTTSYLESCAKSLLSTSDDQAIDSGARPGFPMMTKIPSFSFNEKFMKTLEKHLINLEEEVPDIKPVHEIKVEVKRKKPKKYHFNDSVHKKSIIVEHLKCSKSDYSTFKGPDCASFSNVYRRKPRD
jgi:hypothetical protein